MLSADVIDDMLNRLSGRRTMTVKEALRRCADELEAELNARYANTLDYPSMKRKYDLDMQTVIDARAALAAAEKDESELVAALKDAKRRLSGAGMLGGYDDPVRIAIAKAEPHIHVAGHLVGKHIDECALCGHDIRSSVHSRAALAKHAAPPSEG